MNPNDCRVVSNFIVPDQKDEPITLYGDDLQTRSFCDVDDLIKGMLRPMDSPKDLVGSVNIGNPSEVAMIDLDERVLRLTYSRPMLSLLPPPNDGPCRRHPDITVARDQPGRALLVVLGDGLRETIPYFRKAMTTRLS
jgi:UDP-glucuronate decarboxylase